MADSRPRKVCPYCNNPTIYKRASSGDYSCRGSRGCNRNFVKPAIRHIKNGGNISNAFKGANNGKN